MPKTYRALVDFTCPADPESFKKNQEALKTEDADKHAALRASVKWMAVKKGSKLQPYNDALAKSWLENEVVEEVSG